MDAAGTAASAIAAMIIAAMAPPITTCTSGAWVAKAYVGSEAQVAASATASTTGSHLRCGFCAAALPPQAAASRARRQTAQFPNATTATQPTISSSRTEPNMPQAVSKAAPTPVIAK